MNRNENLKTLTWEHHDGLVVSFRLQQGLKKNVVATEMVDYILHIWNNVLENHFWQEEQVIKPNIINSKLGSEYISRMLNDHKKFKHLITRIKAHKSNLADINEFALLLNQHIRFEERKLFPLIEQDIDSKKLQEVGQFLKQNHNPSCEVWPNQFWKN